MKIMREKERVIGQQMILLALSLAISGSCLQVQAAAEPTSRAAKAAENAAKATAGTPKSADLKPGQLEELSLNDLNDVAILLRFISEQSINIYEEAARVPVAVDASPNYKPYETIPVVFKAKQKFLPARHEWLVFYLGIMEPVIRDLAKETAEIEVGSKQLVIPKSVEEVMTPAWESWSHNTKEMNRHLDELVEMFDDNPLPNDAIQNKAVEIHNDIDALEKTRKDIFIHMKSMIKAGKDKIMITPE